MTNKTGCRQTEQYIIFIPFEAVGVKKMRFIAVNLRCGGIQQSPATSTLGLTILAIRVHWDVSNLRYGGTLPDIFHITIARQFYGKEATVGYLIVDGEPVSYTLELPWKNNGKDVSCIPPATYSGIVRYDHHDGWRIELTNVPGGELSYRSTQAIQRAILRAAS